MIKIEVVARFDEFVKLESIWNDFCSQCNIDIPYMTFEWFTCWWQNYEDHNNLFILIVKEDDEILGIAPLMETKKQYRALPANAISFIANNQACRAGFLLLKNKKTVVRYILGYIFDTYKFDMFSIDYIEEGGDTERYLSEVLTEKKIKYRKTPSLSSPYILIDTDWDSYLKSRSKMFRKGLRRINNLVNRNGNVEIRQYTKDDIDDGIKNVLEVSRQTWKYENKTAISSNVNDINFYTSLIKKMSKKEWLNLWVFKLDGKPIAFDFSVSHNKKNYSLKTGFVERYRKLSPSVFLDNHFIKHHFDLKYKEFDLLGDKSEYKMKWTPLLRQHCTIYFFGNSFHAKIFKFLEFIIISRIKKIKFIMKMINKGI